MTGTAAFPFPLSHVFVQAGGNVPQEEIVARAPGLQAWVREDLAPEWAPFAVGDVFRTDDAAPKPGEVKILLLDEPDPSEQGALALHTKDEHGLPIIRVFVGLLRKYGASLWRAIAHEMEYKPDPECDVEVTLPDGRVAAFEICDQVEETGYQKLGTDVSNFNLKSNFGIGSTSGPYDKMGLQKQMFTCLPGGYLQTLGPTGWTMTTAEEVAPTSGLAAYHAHLHGLGLSRRARRHRKHAAKRARIEALIRQLRAGPQWTLNGDDMTADEVYEMQIEMVRAFLRQENR